MPRLDEEAQEAWRVYSFGQGYLKVGFMEIHQIPLLREPVMVIAFSGWNDAAEAASGAVEHLLSGWRDKNDDVIPELIAKALYSGFWNGYSINETGLSYCHRRRAFNEMEEFLLGSTRPCR